MASLYSTSVKVDGGRQGHATSDDGRLDLELSIPRSLGGDDGAGTNPEQLFAAGYAACFQTALRHAASDSGLSVSDSSITSRVDIVADNGGFALRVELDVSLPEVPSDKAWELVDRVHSSVCPYSKALKGNVEVQITVV